MLAATDFSPAAELAVRAGLRLVRPQAEKPRLVIVHARQPLVTYGFGDNAMDVEGVEDDAQHVLESFAAAMRDEAGEIETLLRQGYPARVIEREAGRCGADLIVLGTHGRGGLGRLMLGSTAERVLHHSPCPVLTVRQPVSAAFAGTTTGAAVASGSAP